MFENPIKEFLFWGVIIGLLFLVLSYVLRIFRQ